MSLGTRTAWVRQAGVLALCACGGDEAPMQPPPNESPTATIGAPTDGATLTEGAAITFQGAGSDPEDGALPGSALSWSSDRDGPLGSGTSITRDDLSVGTHRITLTATDGDGATGTASIGITVQPATGNQLPMATIAAPANGSNFSVGEQISFQGSASDPEDGALTGAALVWASSVDGEIGTGVSFTRDDLSAGNHTITLTATDGDGGVGMANVQIAIQAAGGQVVDMTIEDDAFVDPLGRRNDQASVTITLGDMVRWTYLPSEASTHTVTSGVGAGGNQGSGVPPGGTAMNSPLLQPGGVFDFTPDAVGTWTYFCQVHPSIMINATIVVDSP